MKNRPVEELKRIAVDFLHGRIFTDRHCQRPEDVKMVFMPFALLSPKQFRKLKKDPPGMIFEYLDKVAPRGINGMPCFYSCQLLSQEDTKTVLDMYQILKKTEEDILEVLK